MPEGKRQGQTLRRIITPSLRCSIVKLMLYLKSDAAPLRSFAISIYARRRTLLADGPVSGRGRSWSGPIRSVLLRKHTERGSSNRLERWARPELT